MCVCQVVDEDLKRVAAATGAAVQTTVNNLDPKVLGTCANFEEVQASGPSLLPLGLVLRLWLRSWSAHGQPCF